MIVDKTEDILVEELGELLAALGKCRRFGLHQAWEGKTNKERLEEEIGQVEYMLVSLRRKWKLDDNEITSAYLNKENRIAKYEQYHCEDIHGIG